MTALAVVGLAFDPFIIFTLFPAGFVVIAKAGANLNQQFGAPLWFGSPPRMIPVIIAGRLNVRRITEVAGVMTLLIVIFIVAAGSYSFTHPSGTITSLAVIGFIISFVGSGDLSGYLFPAIGHVGITVCVVILTGWLKERPFPT